MAEETKKEEVKKDETTAKATKPADVSKKETAEAPKEAKAANPAAKSKKKPRRRIVPEGRAYIQASFNNTLISITDPKGESAFSGQSSIRTNTFSPFFAPLILFFGTKISVCIL